MYVDSGGSGGGGGHTVDWPSQAASKNGHLGQRIARWHLNSRVLHLMVRSLYFSWSNSLPGGELALPIIRITLMNVLRAQDQVSTLNEES
jgi:hypothetical protein